MVVSAPEYRFPYYRNHGFLVQEYSLEKVFKDNTATYEGFGELLTIINMGIITAGTANSGLVLKKEKEGVYIEESGTARPTWRQSELDAAKDFPDYDAQKSFLNGEEVPYGTKGSVRPDYYKDGYSVDIKNYNVESTSDRSNLARDTGYLEKFMSDGYAAMTDKEISLYLTIIRLYEQ